MKNADIEHAIKGLQTLPRPLNEDAQARLSRYRSLRNSVVPAISHLPLEGLQTHTGLRGLRKGLDLEEPPHVRSGLQVLEVGSIGSDARAMGSGRMRRQRLPPLAAGFAPMPEEVAKPSARKRLVWPNRGLRGP